MAKNKREAGKTHFVQTVAASLLTPFSQTQVCPACASYAPPPHSFRLRGSLVSSFSRHQRENIVLNKRTFAQVRILATNAVACDKLPYRMNVYHLLKNAPANDG